MWISIENTYHQNHLKQNEDMQVLRIGKYLLNQQSQNEIIEQMSFFNNVVIIKYSDAMAGLVYNSSARHSPCFRTPW
jgi:hypothetical protein